MLLVQNLFSFKRSEDDFNRFAKNIFNQYKNDEICVSIMLDIQKRRDLLLGYLNVKGTPTTNNLIESFNSHFESRFKSIKGFESFKHANLWVNAYILRRRTQQIQRIY